MIIPIYFLLVCFSGIFIFRELEVEHGDFSGALAGTTISLIIGLFWPVFLFVGSIYLFFKYSNKGIDFLVNKYKQKGD